ncbi:MAG: hypothetical protein DSY90_07085 [Deltaproteobacteria bacterium]|nr:MAG: hypothetical protein DSY90_07085 [Deltaproteobacteria bacterium]
MIFPLGSALVVSLALEVAFFPAFLAFFLTAAVFFLVLFLAVSVFFLAVFFTFFFALDVVFFVFFFAFLTVSSALLFFLLVAMTGVVETSANANRAIKAISRVVVFFSFIEALPLYR